MPSSYKYPLSLPFQSHLPHHHNTKSHLNKSNTQLQLPISLHPSPSTQLHVLTPVSALQQIKMMYKALTTSGTKAHGSKKQQAEQKKAERKQAKREGKGKGKKGEMSGQGKKGK